MRTREEPPGLEGLETKQPALESSFIRAPTTRRRGTKPLEVANQENVLSYVNHDCGHSVKTHISAGSETIGGAATTEARQRH